MERVVFAVASGLVVKEAPNWKYKASLEHEKAVALAEALEKLISVAHAKCPSCPELEHAFLVAEDALFFWRSTP